MKQSAMWPMPSFEPMSDITSLSGSSVIAEAPLVPLRDRAPELRQPLRLRIAMVRRLVRRIAQRVDDVLAASAGQGRRSRTR